MKSFYSKLALLTLSGLLSIGTVANAATQMSDSEMSDVTAGEAADMAKFQEF